MAGVEHRAAGAGTDRFLGHHDAQLARQPGGDGGDAVAERVGQVAGQQHHLLDAVARQLLQRPGQKRTPANGQDRLRRGRRERPQPGAEPAHEHRRLTDGGLAHDGVSTGSVASLKQGLTLPNRHFAPR